MTDFYSEYACWFSTEYGAQAIVRSYDAEGLITLNRIDETPQPDVILRIPRGMTHGQALPLLHDLVSHIEADIAEGEMRRLFRDRLNAAHLLQLPLRQMETTLGLTPAEKPDGEYDDSFPF